MTNQQTILEGVKANIQAAIEASNIGVELGDEKYIKLLPVLEAELEKVNNAKPMTSDEFLSFIGGINSQLQKVK